MMSKIKSHNDIFREFASLYSDTVVDIPKYGIYRLKKFNKKNQTFDKDKINQLKEYYDEINRGILNPNTEWNEWLLFVKEFAYFIRFSEKCYFYRNAPENDIYVEIADDLNSLTSVIIYINIDELDLKTEIHFKETMIADLNSSNNNILNFLEDEEVSDNIEFITINIIRNYGRAMNNEFKFTYGLNVPIKDTSDIILIDSFRRLISKKIMEIFNNIILASINNVLGITDEYTVEELVNNELYISK